MRPSSDIDCHNHGKVGFKAFCLLLLVFTGLKGQELLCEDRSFGEKCQFQCHCLNDAVCDKVTGDCPGSCDVRWFGPQCQYWDAAYNAQSNLTDGSGTSRCLTGDTLIHDFPMLEDVMFTWLRIVTNKLGLFDNVAITFLSRSEAVVAPKYPLTRIYLSDTILDVYGELQDRFKTIRLEFDTVLTKQFFCSMHVSSGRNVAIKQIASQSSTTGNYVAEKAVDGKPNQGLSEGSCTATDTREDSAYWTLNLSLPVTVNMYTILGRSDVWALCRLRYFRLESYFESTEVLQYVKTDTAEQSSYNVYPVDTSTITSVTLIVSKDLWPSNKFDCNDGYLGLSFCEMQIYGDVVCDPGKWGRDCEKDCNCQDPTGSCFVSTGMCPSGCKAGFHGPGCQEVCAHTTYVDGCNQTCSVNCGVNVTQEPAICEHVTDELYLVIIIVPTVLGLTVIAALITGIYFWRRRYAKKAGKEAVLDDGAIHESEIGRHVEMVQKKEDPVNNIYEEISHNLNGESRDSNKDENMRTCMNGKEQDSNENENMRTYINEEDQDSNENENMRTYINEEEQDSNENENMRTYINEEDEEYDKISHYVNEKNSMHKYEEIRTSKNENNLDGNVNKINPYINEEMPHNNECGETSAIYREKEQETGTNTRDTESHLYSEPAT